MNPCMTAVPLQAKDLWSQLGEMYKTAVSFWA